MGVPRPRWSGLARHCRRPECPLPHRSYPSRCRIAQHCQPQCILHCFLLLRPIPADLLPEHALSVATKAAVGGLAELHLCLGLYHLVQEGPPRLPVFISGNVWSSGHLRHRYRDRDRNRDRDPCSEQKADRDWRRRREALGHDTDTYTDTDPIRREQ
jgi:hypothetical protein